jgi:hypothetical protein
MCLKINYIYLVSLAVTDCRAHLNDARDHPASKDRLYYVNPFHILDFYNHHYRHYYYRYHAAYCFNRYHLLILLLVTHLQMPPCAIASY